MKQAISAARVSNFVESIFAEDVHAKRVASIADATIGVLAAGSLSVHAIGRGLAGAEGLNSKHAIKQVDRMVGNEGVDVETLLGLWVPDVIGARKEVVVALDWTDFDRDNQSTIAAYLVTSHGRATPLMWKTVVKSALRGWRNAHEDDLLARLRQAVPVDVKVTVLADRGFGDQKLYELLTRLGFDYVVRFRSCIKVTDQDGECRTAGARVPTNGRSLLLRGAKVTGKRYQVGAVVCVKAKGMKEPWCLAASSEHVSSEDLVVLYGRRFTIEEAFRDAKDIRFGMGLASARVSTPERRDRLLFVSALATVLLTLLGAAGESLGMERMLKSNTAKRRVYSLFSQGRHYYDAIPNMPEERLRPLVERFVELVQQRPFFREVFGPI